MSANQGLKLIRSVGAIGFGNAVSKIIMFLANILIANHLLDEGYGQLSIAFLVVNYLSLVFFSGVDTVTTRKAASCDSSHLPELTSQLFGIRLILCLILIALSIIAAWLIGGNIGWLLIIYALSFLPQIFYSVNLFYGCEWPFPIMIYFIGGRIVYLILLIIGFKNSSESIIVPVAFGLSILAENLFLLIVWSVKYKIKKFFCFKFTDFNKWKSAFPLTFSSAFLLLHENAGLILVAILLGSSLTGIYAASYRLVYIAISLATLLSYVFLSRLTKIKDHLYLRKFLLGSYIVVAFVGLCMAIIGSLLANFIVDLIYVECYQQSAAVLMIAIWQMVLAPVRILSFQTLNAFKMQNKALPFIIISSVISIIINCIFVSKLGICGAAIGTVIGELIITTTMIVLVQKLVAPK